MFFNKEKNLKKLEIKKFYDKINRAYAKSYNILRVFGATNIVKGFSFKKLINTVIRQHFKDLKTAKKIVLKTNLSVDQISSEISDDQISPDLIV